ncbi:MAG: transposase [Bacteroidota bacterium]|nr:transposase [Bacteroidota bacterium]
MSRIERTSVGDYVYHVLNRANARVPAFESDKDYATFESILEDAVAKFDMRLLAYCIMPNHWHLVLYPKNDGDLIKFMGWLSNTHTRRWHMEKHTIGEGHLYQGRYKSLICQNDDHFITLVRYVEQNALKAHLVDKAQDWRWSSVWRREYGNATQKKLLSAWPVDIPEDYLTILNQLEVQPVEEEIEHAITKSKPFGDEDWVTKSVRKFGLEQTLRNAGRPFIRNDNQNQLFE